MREQLEFIFAIQQGLPPEMAGGLPCAGLSIHIITASTGDELMLRIIPRSRISRTNSGSDRSPITLGLNRYGMMSGAQVRVQ